MDNARPEAHDQRTHPRLVAGGWLEYTDIAQIQPLLEQLHPVHWLYTPLDVVRSLGLKGLKGPNPPVALEMWATPCDEIQRPFRRN